MFTLDFCNYHFHAMIRYPPQGLLLVPPSTWQPNRRLSTWLRGLSAEDSTSRYATSISLLLQHELFISVRNYSQYDEFILRGQSHRWHALGTTWLCTSKILLRIYCIWDSVIFLPTLRSTIPSTQSTPRLSSRVNTWHAQQSTTIRSPDIRCRDEHNWRWPWTIRFMGQKWTAAELLQRFSVSCEG